MTEQRESLHFLDYWRVIRSRKETVIAVFLLVVLTGILVTYAMPKAFMASVIIQVKEERPDVDPFASQQIIRGYTDQNYLRTQFEIIQSAPIIEDVIRKLNLTEKLGRAYGYLDALGEKATHQTYKIVSRNMKVQQYRDTNLIEIQMYLNELGGPDEEAPRVVAEIADEVAQTYRNQSMERTRIQTERALKAMLEALEEQRTKVGEAEAKVAVMREKYQIDVLGSWAYGRESSLAQVSMANLEAARIRVRLELEDKKARYDTMSSLSTNVLLDAAHVIIGDPSLSALVAEKRKAEVELARLMQAELGPRHPDVMRGKAIIVELDLKVSDALNGLKTGVQHDYETEKAKYEAVEAEMAKLTASERNKEVGGYREFNKASEELDHARKLRDVLESRYLQEKIALRIPRTTVEVIQPAKVPQMDDPVRPNVPLNIVLSIILGLTAGLALAYFVEYLDTSVKTIEDIERTMGSSVLGVIPQKVRALIDKTAEPAHAEAYRVLRTNIQFSKSVDKGKTLCVTSGSVGEGKSLTLFNLAYVCAQLGDKVLIVDSDLHRPRQHKIVGVSNHVGLATVLMGKATIEEAAVPTANPNLHLLPSGRVPSGSHGLLATQKMTETVARLKTMYDWVLFDSPPIIGVSDASLLVREVDGVLLVIQHREYPRALSMRARDMITNVGGNLLGVVLNNINISRDHTYYYYQQHYYYYPRRDKPAEKDGEKAEARPAPKALS